VADDPVATIAQATRNVLLESRIECVQQCLEIGRCFGVQQKLLKVALLARRKLVRLHGGDAHEPLCGTGDGNVEHIRIFEKTKTHRIEVRVDDRRQHDDVTLIALQAMRSAASNLVASDVA